MAVVLEKGSICGYQGGRRCLKMERAGPLFLELSFLSMNLPKWFPRTGLQRQTLFCREIYFSLNEPHGKFPNLFTIRNAYKI